MKKIAPVLLLLLSLLLPQVALARESEQSAHNWLWVEGAFGYSYSNLARFSINNFLPEVRTIEGSGIAGSLGLGVDLFLVRLGLRGAYAKNGDFNIGTAVAELNLDIPIALVDLWIRTGFGFAWLSDINLTGWTGPDPTIRGWTVPLGLGVNVHITDFVYVGGGGEFSLLKLKRGSVTGFEGVTDVDLKEGGDSFGYQIRGGLHVGLTF